MFDNLYAVYLASLKLISMLSFKKKKKGKCKTGKEKLLPNPSTPLSYRDKDTRVSTRKVSCSKTKICGTQESKLTHVGESACKRKIRREKKGMRGEGMRGREGKMLCRWFIKN